MVISYLSTKNGANLAKYPTLKTSETASTLRKISNKSFNTYEFISEWEKLYPDSKNIFSGIGEGWRKVIGRQLSIYATSSGCIKSLKRKKQGAELWCKS